jgi:tetratricopeptide (TPR) repeat protein
MNDFDEKEPEITEEVDENENDLSLQKAYLLFEKGSTLMQKGDLLRAQKYFLKAGDRFLKKNRFEQYAEVCQSLGIVFRMAGDFERAEQLHRLALELYEKEKNIKGQADSFCLLGLLQTLNGELLLAQAYLEKGRLLYEQEKDTDGLKKIRRQMGFVYQEQGDILRAEKEFLPLWQEADLNADFFDYQDCTLNLIHLYFEKRFYKKGLSILEKALNLLKEKTQETQVLSFRAELLFLKGTAFLSLNAFEKAEPLLTESLDFFQKVKNKEQIAFCAASLGLLYLKQENFTEAEKFFKLSLKQEKALKRTKGIAADYANLSLVSFKAGDLKKQKKYAEKAAFYFQQAGEAFFSPSKEEEKK